MSGHNSYPRGIYYRAFNCETCGKFRICIMNAEGWKCEECSCVDSRPMCKGSYDLGTACGNCSRCDEAVKQMAEVAANFRKIEIATSMVCEYAFVCNRCSAIVMDGLKHLAVCGKVKP